MITREDMDRFEAYDDMDMDVYQKQARTFAIYSNKAKIIYPAFGLNSEVGEISDKIKKWIRDGDFDKEEMAKEVGDVLWYVAIISEDLGYNLSDIAQMNLDKLESRKKRGKLRGSGDNR